MSKMLTRTPRHTMVIHRPKFDGEGNPITKKSKGGEDKPVVTRLVAEAKKPFEFTEQEFRDAVAAHGKGAFIGLAPDAEIVSDPKGPQPEDPDARHETEDDGLPGDDEL